MNDVSEGCSCDFDCSPECAGLTTTDIDVGINDPRAPKLGNPELPSLSILSIESVVRAAEALYDAKGGDRHPAEAALRQAVRALRRVRHASAHA